MFSFLKFSHFQRLQNTVRENYKETVPETKKERSAQAWRLGVPRGHGQEAEKSSKWEASKTLIRIPLQMARKCHFEAPEGRCLGWGQVGPNRVPGVPKTKKNGRDKNYKKQCQKLRKNGGNN